VVCGPIQRKENQHVMNERQSISISGKQLPENLAGEGARAQRGRRRGRSCAAKTYPHPARAAGPSHPLPPAGEGKNGAKPCAS